MPMCTNDYERFAIHHEMQSHFIDDTKYLNKHEVVNANEGKKLYKCSICEKTFERKVVYDQHFTSVHKRKRIVGIKNSFN